MNENDDELDCDEAERRARLAEKIAEVMKQMREKPYQPVRLDKLHTGWRFDVTTFSDGHDPMEFILLDPMTRKVRVTDNFYFVEPTECILVGSEDDLEAGRPMHPGVIKHNAKLVIEVNGWRVEETGPDLRIMRFALLFPEQDPFSPWTD